MSTFNSPLPSVTGCVDADGDPFSPGCTGGVPFDSSDCSGSPCTDPTADCEIAGFNSVEAGGGSSGDFQSGTGSIYVFFRTAGTSATFDSPIFQGTGFGTNAIESLSVTATDGSLTNPNLGTQLSVVVGDDQDTNMYALPQADAASSTPSYRFVQPDTLDINLKGFQSWKTSQTAVTQSSYTGCSGAEEWPQGAKLSVGGPITITGIQANPNGPFPPGTYYFTYEMSTTAGGDTTAMAPWASAITDFPWSGVQFTLPAGVCNPNQVVNLYVSYGAGTDTEAKTFYLADRLPCPTSSATQVASDLRKLNGKTTKKEFNGKQHGGREPQPTVPQPAPPPPSTGTWPGWATALIVLGGVLILGAVIAVIVWLVRRQHPTVPSYMAGVPPIPGSYEYGIVDYGTSNNPLL